MFYVIHYKDAVYSDYAVFDEPDYKEYVKTPIPAKVEVLLAHPNHDVCVEFKRWLEKADEAAIHSNEYEGQ